MQSVKEFLNLGLNKDFLTIHGLMSPAVSFCGRGVRNPPLGTLNAKIERAPGDSPHSNAVVTVFLTITKNDESEECLDIDLTTSYNLIDAAELFKGVVLPADAMIRNAGKAGLLPTSIAWAIASKQSQIFVQDQHTTGEVKFTLDLGGAHVLEAIISREKVMGYFGWKPLTYPTSAL